MGRNGPDRLQRRDVGIGNEMSGSVGEVGVVGSMSRRGHRQTNNWILQLLYQCNNGRLLQPKIVVAPNQRDGHRSVSRPDLLH